MRSPSESCPGVQWCDDALGWRAPEILNTDQGSQFTSEAFANRVLGAGVSFSMDGRGRALDNIFIERLWRSLKYEAVYPPRAVSGAENLRGGHRKVPLPCSVRYDCGRHAIPEDDHPKPEGDTGLSEEARIVNDHLNAEDREIVEKFERGELRRAAGAEGEVEAPPSAARSTFKKTRRVHLRVTERDFNLAHARACEEGIPYQAVLSSVIHNYLSGRLSKNIPPPRTPPPA